MNERITLNGSYTGYWGMDQIRLAEIRIDWLLLLTLQWIFRFHKRRGISWLAKWQLLKNGGAV